VIVVDRLLASGIGWVLRRVSDAVFHELYDESSLREELLAAEMRLELGEIDEEEFRRLEKGLLERMRQARGDAGPMQAPESGARYTIDVEADVGEEGATGEAQSPGRSRKPRKRAPAARKRSGGRAR
jgi:hypothetical protein